MNLKSPYLVRLLRQQFIYVALAAVVGGIVWANRLDINPDRSDCLHTHNRQPDDDPARKPLRFLYWEEPFPRNWVIYVGLMLVLMVPGVCRLPPCWSIGLRRRNPRRSMHFIRTGLEASHPDHDRLRDGGFPLRH